MYHGVFWIAASSAKGLIRTYHGIVLTGARLYCYTQRISKIDISQTLKTTDNIVLAIDSTGIKVTNRSKGCDTDRIIREEVF